MSDETGSSHRLPTTVVPRRYTLELEPDLVAHTFAGTVDIEVEISETVTEIVLNAAELSFVSAAVTQGDSHVSASVTTDEDAERATLSLEGPVAAGAATISMTYNGILNDKLRGFYRSTFTDTDGNEQTLATTQFESTSARRAFPCWDEPEHKASFMVSLVVPQDLFAISSGPEVSAEDLGDGRRRVVFGETVLMSTYLLAFVVGPLEATEPVDVNGTPVRIVHPVGKGHLTSFALDAACFSLAYFEDYFGIDYPEAKLDLVAVPDFAFGAMENFGCATFREILLIIDTETATPSELERSVDVIAHEIAHMWFGDLVTMEWWEGIWLKEAFATFCELLVTDAFRPEWDRWTSFGLSRSAAFDTDSLQSTRPIEFTVVSPADAEAMYDVLTYEKGAAVVRMLQQFLGEDRFQAGINHYLAKHSYANTRTTDLWDALEETTGQPARQIMDSWIFQGGYPLVSVEKVGPTTLRFSQQRFGYSDDTPATLWQVPLVLNISSGGSVGEHRILLTEEATVVDIGGDEIEWVQANVASSGFYRVRYVDQLQGQLVAARAQLTPLERYSMLDDAWAGFTAGRVSKDDLFAIIEAFADDDDLSVWQRIAGVLASLDHRLNGHDTNDAHQQYRAWARGILRPALERFGSRSSTEDNDRVRQTRSTIFAALGGLGDEAAAADARVIHAEVDEPTLKAASVSVVADTGTTAEWEDFLARYENADTPQEERRYLYSLADFPDPELTARLLQMVTDDKVRSQDAPYVLASAMTNPAAGADVWAYVTDNWELLNSRFPDNSIPRMVSGVSALDDEAMSAQIEQFFVDNPIPQGGKRIDQLLERRRVNVAVRNRLRAPQ